MTRPPRRELSLAHLTVLDATPPELVTVAAAAGFRQVGIRLTATPSVGVPPYDVLGDTPMLRETLRRLADTGVSVLDVEFLRFEPEIPIGIPEGFLEAGARLGAKYVLVMSTEPEEARTLDRFGELCDRAAQYGLARLPRVRDLHRREDPCARRAHGEAVGPAECVDPGGCAALQPIGRDARRHRARRSVALSLRADLRRGAGHAHRSRPS